MEAKEQHHNKDILPLDQIKLHIGDMMQLQIQSEHDGSRHYVTLVGYLKGQGVIVTTPQEDGKVMMVREGQAFVVRFFSGKNAYAFSAIAKRVTNVPFPHLHLTYPKEVRGMVVRRSSRARVNIIGSVSSPAGKKIACAVRDISAGGASIATKEAVGALGEHLVLSLLVKVSDEAEHVLNLEGQIRSVHEGLQPDEKTKATFHGVSFENLSAQDSLVLTALLYNSMLGTVEEP
ncbi:MAG: flagellar brake protein [Nitrosomonadales bacterium]|nr:flagellar brake protein [Nitrosomonadales bacterium]